RFEEGAHRIVLGHEEKIDGAVGASDVAVEADAEACNDFANFARRAVRGVLFRRLLCCLFRHSYWLPFDRPAQPRVATLLESQIPRGDVGIKRVFAGAGFVKGTEEAA